MLEDENKKAKKDSSTDVIVIGVGSIGYRHLRYAANRYANVVAIDTDEAILLEKPVSNSISTCQDLVALQRLSGASIVVGFRRRHSGIVEAVRRSANEHCGSPPTTVVVHGGGSGHVNERHSLARFCLRAI